MTEQEIAKRAGLEWHETYGNDLELEITLQIEALKGFMELLEDSANAGAGNEPTALEHAATAGVGLVEALEKNLKEMAGYIFDELGGLSIVRPSHQNSKGLDYTRPIGIALGYLKKEAAVRAQG